MLATGNSTVVCATPASLALQETYAYDKLGNVSSRTQSWNSGITGGLVAPTGFSESFAYDGLNRLSSSSVVGGATQRFTYDLSGNMTSKTGNGGYYYLENNVTQPHAVSVIDGIGSFSYDLDGNQVNGNGRVTSWNSFDMPQTITRSGNSSSFAYGPDHERTSQQEITGGVASKVFYGGAQEVQMDASNHLLSVKTYWPNGLGVEIDRPGQAATELDWTHSDRLGSIVAISDGNGSLKEAMGFDAWGSRRAFGGTAAVTPTTTQVTETTDDKGYTGQEMMDPVELVHLNGRVYDPLVGKFLSGDPLVGDPVNGQNYNRYSYVLNNPTNDIDPTGFAEEKAPAAPPPSRQQQPKSCSYSEEICKAIQNAMQNGTITIVLADGSSVTLTFRDGGLNSASRFGPSVFDRAVNDLTGMGKQVYNDFNGLIPQAVNNWTGTPGNLDIHSYEKYGASIGSLVGMMVAPEEAAEKEAVVLAKQIPEQLHHFATNKSLSYTPAMAKIAEKFGLDLDEIWNIEPLSHSGRHPNAYHEYVLNAMRKIEKEAAGSQEKFLELFDKYVKEPVRQAPEMLRKDWWK